MWVCDGAPYGISCYTSEHLDALQDSFLCPNPIIPNRFLPYNYFGVSIEDDAWRTAILIKYYK